MNGSFAVFDIDGTIFRSSLYLEVVTELTERGIFPPDTAEEFQPAFAAWQERTHLTSYDEYRIAVVNAYEKRIIGLKASDFDAAADSVVSRMKNHTYVYPRRLIKSLKKKGYFMIAISGSQLEMVEKFAKYWGFDAWVGQQHKRRDGVLTAGGTKTHKEKQLLLKKVVDSNGLNYEKSYAVGDSIGDRELLEAVQNPIAFNPDRQLFEHAEANDWKIVVERKNMIYQFNKINGRYVLENE